MTEVRVGVCIPNFGNRCDTKAITEVARKAEELGYDSVWVTDHILLPKHLSYPYGRIFEPLVTLAYVAAVTTRVRLGTSMIILPMRNPVITAKELASIDNLSGGRVIAGLAIGWAEEEFRNLGAGHLFRKRAKLFEEQVALIRQLWSEREVRFEGRFYRIENGISDPRPLQPGGIPIWLGGNSEQAVRRALRIAEAWQFTGIPLDELEHRMGIIKEEARRDFIVSGRFTVDMTGKAPRESKAASGARRIIISGNPQEVINQLEQYIEKGTTYLVLGFGDKDKQSLVKDMERFSREVQPSIQ